MSRYAKIKENRRRVSAAIRATEPEGPIRCAAELVTVEPAVEAADGKSARRPSFNILAYTGGLLRVGWSRPLVVDIAGVRAGRTTILLDHESSQIVGQGQASVSDGKITVAGEITGDLGAGTPSGQVVLHAKNGFVWAASIGVSPERIEPIDANQQVTVNGRSFNGPIYVVRAGRLGEVSFVGVGADENAVASVAARKDEPMNFDQWLQAKGIDKSKISGVEYETLHAQYQHDHPGGTVQTVPQTPAMPAAAVTATLPHQSTSSRVDERIAEGQRRRAMEDLVVAEIEFYGCDPGIAEGLRALLDTAIEAGTSVQDFEMQILRRRVEPAPRIGGGGDGSRLQIKAKTIEAAAMMSLGYSDSSLVKAYGERTVGEANEQFGADFGLQEMMLRCAAVNGYRGRQRVTISNWREVLGYAVPQQVKAAFSTVSLANILGSVANKAMATEANAPDYIVPRLFGTVSHSNFHAHTVCSLALNGELATVTPTGELDHMNLSEETYTRQVGTRGAVLRLSRQDIVNDDLGAFNRMAQALARKSYTTREKVGMTLIMASGAGASHFTAARVNYLTGADTAFGLTGLGGAVKAFMGLTGPDGDPVLVQPSIVLVPPTLMASAETILAATATGLIVTGLSATNARAVEANKNIYAGRYTPLTSPYLEKSTITGYSTAYWYMFADPSRLPCYEIAYLNGQQAPTVEYFGLEAEADTLGVAWRVYWDFGVAAAEWRAGVKSAGA